MTTLDSKYSDCSHKIRATTKDQKETVQTFAKIV